MSPELAWYWLGRVGYEAAISLQETLRDRILAGDEAAATLILLEHDPVVTQGRSSKATSLTATSADFARRGVELVTSSRGGDVTYHGPGQLMVYPVIRLSAGVASHVEALATALAELAANFGVGDAEWRRDPAGLWVERGKLGACGLHVHHGVAIHGFAFNVATPPAAWQGIVPCGLPTMQVTSLAELCARRRLAPPPPVKKVAEQAAPIICAALGRHPVGKVCPFVG